MDTIAQLAVKLALDARQYVKGLGDAGKQAEGFSSKVAGSLVRATQQAESFGSKVSGILKNAF